jgi:hypothetical protein
MLLDGVEFGKVKSKQQTPSQYKAVKRQNTERVFFIAPNSQWDYLSVPKVILSAIQNPNYSLNYNLPNFSRIRFNMFNPSYKLGIRNITNWELYNVINFSGALNRTTFWRLDNGVYEKISKPYWIK